MQSPDGTKRIEISNESLEQLYSNVFKEFRIVDEHCDSWGLFKDREQTNRLPNSKRTRAMEYLSHGEMIYLLQANKNVSSAVTDTVCIEDEVDNILDKQDGLIKREKDEMLCHHGPQGKCLNCIPLEPYDMSYLSSQNPPIKFVSFHGYLKSRKSGIDKLVFIICYFSY